MAAPLLNLITGPLLVGTMLSYFLLGVFAVQLYFYFSTYGETDRKLIIGVVYLVTFIEVVQIFFASHTSFDVLVTSFANPARLLQSPWSSAGLPTLNGAVGMIVQFFFAWRVYTLSKTIVGRLYAGLIVLVALMQFSASLAISIQFGLLDQDYTKVVQLNNTVRVWLGGSFACDLLISLGIVVLLVGRKENAMFSSSRNTLNILIANTIENGAVTTVCALGQLICFLVYPDNYLHVCFEFMLGRLYANVLLATLNGRQRFRGTQALELTSSTRATSAASKSLQYSKPTNGSYIPSSANTNIKSYPTTVSVSTEHKVDRDLFSGDGSSLNGSKPVHVV